MSPVQGVTMSYLIEQHLLVLQAEGRSEDTINSRRRCLHRLHADLPHGIAAGCREQLTEWLAGPQEPGRRWSPATRYSYFGHASEFYRWLAAEYPRLVPEDPMARMRRPKVPMRVPRPATQRQLELALVAPEPLLTAVILATYGGLRRSEILACHREHITAEHIRIPVAKGGDEQTVPTHPAIWDHVRDRPDGPLIGDEHGGQCGRNQFSLMAMRWFRRNGLPGFGLHRLRVLYGTTIQEQQGDLRLTQECMRHKSINSTVGYTLVTDSRRRDAVLRLPWTRHRAADDGPVPPAPAE